MSLPIRERVLTLKADLRRQFPQPGAHSATICNACQGEYALGATRCADCITRELASIVGDIPAWNYRHALRAVMHALGEIDEALDRQERGL